MDGFGFMIASVFDILIFSIFVTLGYLHRNKLEYHKRWMLLATIGGLLLDPLSKVPYIAGQPSIFMLAFFIFVFLPIIHDLISLKRVHPANIGGQS